MLVETKLKGLDEEIKRVVAMAERAADLTPVMKGRAEQFVGVIKIKVFGKGAAPDGSPWAPLEQATIDGRRRGKKRGVIKTLVDTARMQNLTVARGTKTGMVFGNADIAGKVNAHLFGTKNAGRGRSTTIPRRAFLPVDKHGRADFSAGPAAEWLARTTERVKLWVEKGKL